MRVATACNQGCNACNQGCTRVIRGCRRRVIRVAGRRLHGREEEAHRSEAGGGGALVGARVPRLVQQVASVAHRRMKAGVKGLPKTPSGMDDGEL